MVIRLAVASLAGFLALTGAPAIAQAPGPEVCANCHADHVATFQASKHGTKADARTPVNKGACAFCHGDGTEHVKAGGGRGVGGIRNLGSKTLPAAEKTQICLTCHQGGNRIHFQSSVHGSRDVACTNCHKLHTASDTVRDKQTQTEVCFTCHKEQRSQVNRPVHHPIVEGKMSCSSCHNVHGDNPKQLVRDSVNETCFTCHMEKRGPFVHNHAPVQEDCAICHQPHGTTITSLLKARPPFLCQECHSHTSHPGQAGALPTGRTTSTGALGSVARGCLNCHTNIHGSNSTQNSATAGRFRR
jgi:DmsE family decaheme c-type cytochrome